MARQENAQPAAAHSGEIGALSFEQALQELERIVGQLERGDVGLEHSISLYERGEALRAHCDQLLKVAEAKVEQITMNASGQPRGTAPLDLDAR